ncbi:AfsA-related hotdog domain-containing protein [Streptomyces sp. NPDC046876]|uniref:AfsA-related hotdog domain-containing protein n=1 Tax=Streptomyces sp. NPDC046876 TaxID=3155616 RepID=UPI00340A0706
MESTAVAPWPLTTTAARHLVHRPGRSAGPGAGEEEFVLTGPLPGPHPLGGTAAPGAFHDLQAAAEMLREVGEVIGQEHFRVPADRTGIFYRFALDAGDLEAWRRGPGEAELTSHVRVSAEKVLDGVPRALEFTVRHEIDGADAGHGSAHLLFLPPLLHRNHRESSRTATLKAAAAAGSGSAPAEVPGGRPVAPAEVGRTDPAHVLLRGAAASGDGRLTAEVCPPRRWPGSSPADTHASSPMLLETVRQASLLAVHRTGGAPTERLAPAALQLHFRGYAEADLPLRAAVVTGPAGLDPRGRRLVPLTLTLAQAGRAVLEARTTVAEDR